VTASLQVRRIQEKYDKLQNTLLCCVSYKTQSQFRVSDLDTTADESLQFLLKDVVELEHDTKSWHVVLILRYSVLNNFLNVLTLWPVVHKQTPTSDCHVTDGEMRRRMDYSSQNEFVWQVWWVSDYPSLVTSAPHASVQIVSPKYWLSSELRLRSDLGLCLRSGLALKLGLGLE